MSTITLLGCLIGCFGPLVDPALAAGAPARLLLEAEDFKVGSGWQRLDWEESYFCASFANDFLSRQACLRAPAQGRAAATMTVRIPQEGEYTLFARYACPYMHNVVFRVAVEQDGVELTAHAFGRLQANKIWPFGGGIQPMPTYSWGGGDNIVWEQAASVRLAEGEATITLTAHPQPEPAAERQVDVLVLTPMDEEVTSRLKSWSYLPLDGLLTQAGDLFLRITNPRSASGPLLMQLTTTEHSPYWVHRRDWQTPLTVGAAGALNRPATPEDALPVGAATPWVEIGSRVDRLNESTLIATPVREDPVQRGIHAVFEFAVPDGKSGRRIIRKINCADATARCVRFAVPGDLHRGGQIRTAEEEMENLLAYVRSLPKHGRTPTHVGIRGVLTSHYVGTNTSTRLDELVAQLQKELVGGALTAGIEVTSLGDEIGLSLAPRSPAMDEAFRAYLKAKGLTPQELLPPDAIQRAQALGVEDLWSQVELNYEDRATNPRLWYHSQVFGYENGSLAELRKETERITRESDGKMRTGANYSPHPHYWPREFQWVRPFKLGALTMPWSEDYVWGIPEVSPQVTGYLLDVFRCAAKYHDLPICYYVMPHSPGNTPRSFRLSYYEALAHGARLIDHFCVTPIVTAYTENYVSASFRPMYREVHDIARELGQFDDIIATGRVRPAHVALLISGTTDLWDPSVNYNHERKCLYYALRHAGIPVDFLTEEDIAEGRLGDYRVLYMSASHMLNAAARALAAWVEQGGIVCSVAGGGLRDEYGEPSAPMLALLGLESAPLQEHDSLVDTKHTLPRLRPADGLRTALPGCALASLPALGTTQRLRPLPGTQVVGWFHDEGPAATLHRVGSGQALMIGAFPGAAYVAPAIPIRPWDRGTTDTAMNHFLPTEFDPAAAEVILWPVRQAGVEPDIRVSAPLVEWSAVDSDRGTAILLINWTGKPAGEVTVTVRGALAGARVESVEQGPLAPQVDAAGWRVTLPLGVTDCITVRRE